MESDSFSPCLPGDTPPVSFLVTASFRPPFPHSYSGGRKPMKVQLAALAAILGLIASGHVFAQEDVPQKVVCRKWDIGTTTGLLFANGRAYGTTGSHDNDPSWMLNLDAGRFLTTHVKVDTGVTWSGTRSFYKTTFSTA